ncbi:GNAT family N-acetyltransferase [Aestuariispira ectoiniformans]|uniref:GNAT family N-acetyltransferase n=1 Tax=Aestuariispira ectoiniformans TaxID=2775080 RepID=UPI00223A746D|nr:GNAT family N-acetyltransferase [Aestuariispira ectoiniformans]
MTTVTIAGEAPDQPEILALIEALDRYQEALYPAESNHLLDIDSLKQPDISFFVARLDCKAVGCAALKNHGGFGEIKRMFVHPDARGNGISHKLMAALEAEAASRDLAWIGLETGISQPEAISLYRRSGYEECEPFADYQPDPLSLFMRKALQAS